MRVSDLHVGLVSYCVGSEHIYALLLDAEGELQRFEVGRAAATAPKVHALMDVLRQPLGWPSAERARVVGDFAEGWGAGLLPPTAALASFDVLLIVPHHFLHGVPFHLIRIDGKPLATTHGIAYCSSNTQLHRCFERNRARRFSPSAWTFPVDADEAAPGGPPVRTCLSSGVDTLTDKEAAYRDLARVFAGYFEETAFVESREDVKHALEPLRRGNGPRTAQLAPDSLCLVCHGHLDPYRIERSGLMLRAIAGVRSTRAIRVHADSVLYVNDYPFAELPLRLEPVRPSDFDRTFEPELLTISELRVNCISDAELVALFGCSTGIGEEASHDEYMSFASQWLELGAASVIANLWESDLVVLAAWSRRFAEDWVQRRKPKAIASRDATRALLEERADWASDPLLWGSMALFGDWL